jgi:hypothetical protein
LYIGYKEGDLMRRVILLNLLLVAVFVSSRAVAETFRCGDRVVSLGDTKAEVIIKCGDTNLKDSHEESIIKNIDPFAKQKVTVIVDEWTYNLGPDSLIRLLRFENGKLVDIKTGGYGK